MQLLVRLREGEFRRVDKYIASTGLFTRSQIQNHVISVTDSEKKALKLSRRLQNGDRILLEWEPIERESIRPEAVELDIIYEDENVVVINKPQGMVVHPAAGHRHETLAQGLMYRYGIKNFTADRAGIVHRLDKDTSGVMIAARNVQTHSYLSEQFQKRKVKKIYIAIVKGTPLPMQGAFNMPIGRDPGHRKRFTVHTRNAKNAESLYKVLEHSNSYSMLQVFPRTGRTHQIRVHLESFGHPILGDPIYSRKDNLFTDVTLMLHSWQIRINIPGRDAAEFTAPLSPHIARIIKTMGFKLPVHAYF